MPKSKPDKVVVHRIELQQTERDLLEMALLGNALGSGISALMPLITTLCDPVKLYGFLNLLELADVIDTPVPTVADLTVENVTDAIDQFRQNEYNKAGQSAETKEFHTNAAIATEDRRAKVEKQREEANKAYQDGTGSYEAVQILQQEQNRLQAESFRQQKIASGWKYYFYFMLSGMQFDENGQQIPGTGSWPTKWDVLKAKASGEYY